MSTVDPIEVALDVARALERAQAEYAICGSLASTIHGEPRATMDVDVVVMVASLDAARMAEHLAVDFIVDGEALREAVASRSMANVIHARAFTKVDLYFRARVGASAAEIDRALRVQLRAETRQLVRVISAEDTVLQKLRWFRDGGESSDRQWRDVLGVLRTQAGSLDEQYLDRWAQRLEIEDILQRARGDARLPPA